MTQMQVPANAAEDTVADIARQLRTALPGTCTGYLVVASAATFTDTAGLREERAVIRSEGLDPSVTVAMLEQALEHERQRLADA